MENKKNYPGRRSRALGAILLGWASCAYLVFRAAQLKAPDSAVPDLCQTLFSHTCDKALKSSVAVQLGFPLATWGLAYFGLLGLLFSLRKPATDRLSLLIAAFGAGISGLLSVIIIRSNAPCPLCLGVHAINLVALLTLFWSIPLHAPSPEQAPARRSWGRRAVLLLFTALLGGASEYGILKAAFGPKTKVNMDAVVKNFAGETVYDIPRGSSPQTGSPEAPVQIVVFSSFQCPACQAFAPSLEKMHRQFGDKVGITFKNFPLSTRCNPRISDDMQPRACDAAIAALAAQRQNLFWEYHDGIFQSDLEEGEAALRAIAQNIGLNMEQWESDRQSGAVQESLWEDVQLAYHSGINATPTVFINGRRAGALDESVLHLLIQNELKSALK